jgi:hypothetical protein
MLYKYESCSLNLIAKASHDCRPGSVSVCSLFLMEIPGFGPDRTVLLYHSDNVWLSSIIIR